MADTIEIGGKPVKKQTVLIAGAAVAVLGIGVYRYRKQAAANAAADAAANAPGTGAGSSDQIDPATGFPYGSAEDAAALTSQAQYIQPGGTVGLAGGGSPSAYYPQSGGFTSNAAWAQAVEDYLVNTAGADANTVGNALGKYITGGALTDDQVSVVNQAIAFQGYPPVPGPAGYPPSIRTSTSSNPPPTGSGGGTGGGTHYAANPPKGLKLVRNGRTGVQIQWNAVQGATKYNVHTPGRSPLDFTTTNTIANVGNLKPNTRYTVQVWADPTPTGGPHASLTFTTSR